LPPAERRKILQIGRIILQSHQSQQRPVRRVLVVGHADFDTPRRPDVEQRMSLLRAASVEAALIQAVESLSASDRSRPPPRPLYSRRINWKERGLGATQPVVPAPRTEAQRALNRRVEIMLDPRTSVTASRLDFLGQGQPSPNPVTKKLEDAISRFRKCVVRDKCCGLDRQAKGTRPPNTIGAQNCYSAVNEAACRLGKGSVLPPKLPLFGDFIGSQDRRAPYSKHMRCCPDRDDFAKLCKNEAYGARCTHCFGGAAPHLVVKYKQQPLDLAVSTLKNAIDAGFLVRAGVLSGICDDKPDMSCVGRIKKKNPKALGSVWKLCPEHYILIFARDENTFLFYDSSHASILERGEFTFGLMFYDSADVRLSTARSSSNLDVDSSGDHRPDPGFRDPAPPPFAPLQHRFQVLNLAVIGQWNCAGNEIVPHQDRCWKS
jgi:hypothetical protein